MSRVRGWHTAAGFSLMLALFAARLSDTALQKSLTPDETQYLGTGLYLWESGDYHLVYSLRFHPPLTFHLASLPLLAFDLGDLPLDPNVGRRLLARTEAPLVAIRFASRVPFILLACWGAALCFLWAREVAGDGAAWLAAFLYTFSPTLLAYGCLAHSDITVTVLHLQTLYTFWRWYRRTTPLRLVLCGLSLGLALIAKLSAVLLLGMLALLLGAGVFRRSPPSETVPWIGPETLSKRVAWSAGVFGVLIAIAAGVLWLGYGGSFALAESPMSRFPNLRLPAWVQSLLFVEMGNALGRTVFFLGEFSKEGWWYFFPVAFAIKVPVAVLVLLAAACLTLRARPSRLGRFLAIPFAVYLVIACFWLDVPLGLRYILPLFPLIFVFIATQLAPLGRGWRRFAVPASCAWMAVASLWIHPHYLAYFNELVGGPGRGHLYLLDSNFDWGQDLGTLARYLRERGNPPVRLAFFGAELPEAHGIRSRPLRGCEPVGGLVAISANVLMGLYSARTSFARPPPGCYDWLQAHEPVARPGYSIFVYELPAVSAGSRERAGTPRSRE